MYNILSNFDGFLIFFRQIFFSDFLILKAFFFGFAF